MKKITTIITVLLFFLFTNSTYAKIWRVNNITGINANYTDVNTAINAGTTLAGDTIHIEPSPTSYGNITVNKRLVFIGNGYLLSGTGGNAGLQSNTNTSTSASFDFVAGSRGSIVEGMSISVVYLEDHQLTVRRNSVSYVYLYSTCDSCNIQQNYVFYVVNNTAVTASRIVITNNLFQGSGYGIGLPSTVSAIIENNTFPTGSYLNVWGSQVDNNIFGSGTVTLNNSVAFNNICDGTEFPAGNGNQQNITMTNVWVSTGSTDGYYFLKPGSPALGTGQNGYDIGFTGGPNPYKLSGIPDVPSIYQLTVPPTGTNTINVTISTRSNN